MSELKIIQKAFYEPIRETFIKLVGGEEIFQKEISFAIQHLNANPYLKERAEQTSVLRAVMNVANVGLSLNPILKYAYLVPRYNKKTNTVECSLDPSYQGLCKLLTDSGAVRSISCNIVYENDEFDIDFGSEQKVNVHKPKFPRSKKMIAVYSLAILPDGSRHIEVMDMEEIYEVRERSESYISFKNQKTKSCIWDSDLGEMCRKTVIKRHFKYLPKSNEIDLKVEKAIELDNESNGYKATDSQVRYLENLLHDSTVDQNTRDYLEDRMFDMDSIECSKWIEHLKENQLESLSTQFDRKIKAD